MSFPSDIHSKVNKIEDLKAQMLSKNIVITGSADKKLAPGDQAQLFGTVNSEYVEGEVLQAKMIEDVDDVSEKLRDRLKNHGK